MTQALKGIRTLVVAIASLSSLYAADMTLAERTKAANDLWDNYRDHVSKGLGSDPDVLSAGISSLANSLYVHTQRSPALRDFAAEDKIIQRWMVLREFGHPLLADKTFADYNTFISLSEKVTPMLRVIIRNGKIIPGVGSEVFIHGADLTIPVDSAKTPPLKGGQVGE